MGDFKVVLPSSMALAICLLLALVILTLLHVMASYSGRLTVVSDEKESLKANGVEVSEPNLLRLMSLSERTWDGRLWEGLPQLSLPISLSVVDNETVGLGVGNGKGVSREIVKYNWQRRSKPEFDAPPFAVYESQVPLSMAKIIMSRHTIRRPNLNRPRPAVQPPARRLYSMV